MCVLLLPRKDEKMSRESLASFIANWSDKGAISWPDFLRMLSFTSQRFDSSEEMREVFRMLDHDNDGRVEVRRLRVAIETLEPQLSVQQVTELIMNAFPERAGSYRDFYQNGTIDFNEFVAFMHSS